MQIPRPPNRLQFALQAENLLLQQSAIRLDLCFTRTAKEAGTAPLTLEMCPGPDQTPLLIVQVSEFHLERALLGPRTPTEDLEDQTGTSRTLELRAFSRLRC